MVENSDACPKAIFPDETHGEEVLWNLIYGKSTEVWDIIGKDRTPNLDDFGKTTSCDGCIGEFPDKVTIAGKVHTSKSAYSADDKTYVCLIGFHLPAI